MINKNITFEVRTVMTQEYAALVSIVANWKSTHALLSPLTFKQRYDIEQRCAELHEMLFV